MPGGNLLGTPFLDLTSKIVAVNAVFDERGLLGVAFHPNYASNGRFFVRYSAPRAGDPAEHANDPDGFVVGCHEEILAEYSVLGNPLTSNVADLASEIILFRVDEPQFNHDSGQVAFGPDGLLYWTLGEGGDGVRAGGVDTVHRCPYDSVVVHVLRGPIGNFSDLLAQGTGTAP
jgi:glucose/arabinose dehydrogenase